MRPVLRDEVLDQFDLTDRVAVITGGSRGIGRAIAGGLAAMGAAVVIASRKTDACERAAAELDAEGHRSLAVPTHMGDPEQIEALVARTVDHFGRLDMVVNNAANALAQPIGEMTTDAMAKSWETNFRGPVLLVQAALEHLRAARSGTVLNITTAGVYTSGANASLYVAAKSAMSAMTRSMAAELCGDGIRVNALAPGTVGTDMVLNTPRDFQEAAVRAQLIDRMATPQEMVPAAVFLLSDASSFMTGHTLIVDGGMTVH